MGVDRVIRVVNDETSDVVVTAFGRRSRDAGHSGETVDTVAEAQRRLENEEIEGYRWGQQAVAQAIFTLGC